MFANMRRILGLVKAEERNNIITISGVPTPDLIRIINKFTGTTKVTRNILLSASDAEFSFHSFYGVEINYILLKILSLNPSWSIKSAAQKIIEELHTQTWMRCTVGPVKPMIDLSLLRGIKWTLKPHQMEFLKVYGTMLPKYNLNGYFLAAGPGTGKTVTDLAVAACIIPRSLAQVKIIISPKNALKLVWENTIKEVFRKQPTYWVSEEPGAAPLGKEYYVFHYEAMDRALDLAKQLAKKGIKYFIAVDESHNFNDIKSLRTQRLVQLCTLVPKTYQVWASGTPIKAMSDEIIPALLCFDPLFTSAVAQSFARAFSSDKKGAMEIVAHRIGLITFKVPTSVVMPSKPTFIPLPVTFPGADKYTLPVIKDQLKLFYQERIAFHQDRMGTYKAIFTSAVEYHKSTLKTTASQERFNQWIRAFMAIRQASSRGMMVDPAVASFTKAYEDQILAPSLPDDLRKQFIAVRTAVKTLRQKVTGESLGKLGQIRIACINDIALHVDFKSVIDNALSKSIIFSTYTKPLDTAAVVLGKLGYAPVQVYGDTSKDVTRLVDYFTNTPEANPLETTYATLSTAVPVIAANTEILLDFPYRQYILDQTVARVQRMGQKFPTKIFQCKLDTGDVPNISTRNEEILKWSENQVETLMGSDSEVDLTGMEFNTAA